MACDISGTSPFADSMLDESWHKTPGGLDAIAEFNAGYDPSHNGDTIDPQLTFGSPRDLKLEPDSFNTTAGASDLEQTLRPGPGTFSAYNQDFDSQLQSGPYYQTIEPDLVSPPQQLQQLHGQQPGGYFPSPLRTAQNAHGFHRRSVSEPPGAHGMPPQPPVTFHRQHHFLGKPAAPKMMPLKSVPRNKQHRQHPYNRKITAPQPQPQPQPMFRPELHRAQTQPTHTQHGPTSMPHSSAPQQMFMSNMMPAPMSMNPPVAMPEPSMYAASRICTPAPETPPSTRTMKIDPSLTGRSADSMRSDLRRTIALPITMEELSAMIFEAVKKAVAAGEDAKKDGVMPESGGNLEEDQKVGQDGTVDEDAGGEEDSI